jgi:hypothetical protein
MVVLQTHDPDTVSHNDKVNETSNVPYELIHLRILW